VSAKVLPTDSRPVPVARRLPAALLDPAAYPHHPEEVQLCETHISWVFLAGDFAHKVKRPVVLPFLDYGGTPPRLLRRGGAR
jgi:aminoglycoside phosphotransferase family enzyme